MHVIMRRYTSYLDGHGIIFENKCSLPAVNDG